MFVGEYRHTLDTKNRIFVPVKLREEIRGQLLILRDVREKCLKVYSEDDFKAMIADKINNTAGRVSAMANRALYHNAALVTPDAQGRVSLTQSLIDYALIKKDVVIVGCGNYAEISSSDVYEEFMSHEDMDLLRDELEQYGI